ncbi:UNVERIFIED_CONTAM: hypothetical protein HDU68_012765, partial [Siphonaria sp. JEL0065]
MLRNPTATQAAPTACPLRLKAIEAHSKEEPKDLVGNVNFCHSLVEAAELPISKPIFLQFQELPGCHTCTSYAANVLAPPLMAEFLATFFTPVLVNNNPKFTTEEDVRVLSKFNEPFENNPTSRIVLNDESLVANSGDVYSLQEIFTYAVNALLKIGDEKVARELNVAWVDALALSAGVGL